jgi:L-iditol 2-dehydrogenase
MKAAVLYGKEDMRVEEVAPRRLAPGEVRVEIEAALTCGTDLKVFKRGYHARMLVPPTVFGHELAGRIIEVAHPNGQSTHHPQGAAAPEWRIGDRVVAANSAPCDACLFCRNGQENLCDDLLFLNGAYAESIVVPARLAQKNLLRLRPGTAFRDAALVEPLACVVQGIRETQLRAGQRVLVLGAGPIGLMFVALARHLGCAVTAVGRGAQRLEAARRLGAEQVFAVRAGRTLESLAAKAPGYDVVIEAVGKPETWQAAVSLARKGGKVNFFGGCPAGTTVSLDTSLLHYSNLTLVASFHHTPSAVREALELIERGVIRAADFVDGECSLHDLPGLFKSMAQGNRAVKTLVRAKG